MTNVICLYNYVVLNSNYVDQPIHVDEFKRVVCDPTRSELVVGHIISFSAFHFYNSSETLVIFGTMHVKVREVAGYRGYHGRGAVEIGSEY